MDQAVSYALEAAKEITVAKVAGLGPSSGLSTNEKGGQTVAGFYEAIFNKVLELARSVEE